MATQALHPDQNRNFHHLRGRYLREKQIQQIYRPYVAVHKWFARRPGSLFRSLVLAEFGKAPLRESYYRAHDFAGKLVADPFMGGGTPVIEANRLGCDVMGFDINPMATWVCREAVEHLDLEAYAAAADDLIESLRRDLGGLYLTDCPLHGDRDVPVKSFLWVKVIACESCGENVDLFPGYLLAEDVRHPLNVLVCRACGDLNEVEDRKNPGACKSCAAELLLDGPAKRGKCACKACGHVNSFPRGGKEPPRHRLFAIEYYNPTRKKGHKGRFFKKPDDRDFARVRDAELIWADEKPRFVPDDDILPGDETDRLHRWGYWRYRDMFSVRQLLGLEASARLIAAVQDERVRHALATNLSDLLRYQNMLCRYDTMALKSLDIFSVHGFPVGLVQCESNLLGIVNVGEKKLGASNVGSGGWSNIVEKYRAAKAYCDAPFEVQPGAKGKDAQVPVRGEWIGERREGSRPRSIAIRCKSSTEVELAPASLDGCFTDPPYFGMVQYGELMDFCYVWLRKLVGSEAEGFTPPSARSAGEVTGNTTKGRDLARFTEGLAEVYRRMAAALKPGAPLAFTFHHNKQESYASVAVAILDAGLTCSASLPCPAEMAGSIHISGTGSSIVDTVFVCRSTGATPKEWLFKDSDGLATIVDRDLEQLRAGGVRPTPGDTRCIVFGHLARMAIWNLRANWSPCLATKEKLKLLSDGMDRLASLDSVVAALTPDTPGSVVLPLFADHRRVPEMIDAVSF
jgi:putative DNA methylase